MGLQSTISTATILLSNLYTETQSLGGMYSMYACITIFSTGGKLAVQL